MLVIDHNGRLTNQRVEEALNTHHAGGDYVFTDMTEVEFLYLRLAVMEGRIDPRHVEIWHNGRRISNMDRNGRLPDWPNGFFDESATLLLQLLGGAASDLRQSPAAPPTPTPPVVSSQSITDIFAGTAREFGPGRVRCPECNGWGYRNSVQCAVCGGNGSVEG